MHPDCALRFFNTMVSQPEPTSCDQETPEHPFDVLNPKQERAILALLLEPTITKAAKTAEVSHRTLVRWLAEEEFNRLYRKARREAFSQAIGLTQHYAPLAVNTLATIMADTSAPSHARVTAASTLLKFGREGIELDDLAARVEALEGVAEKANSTRNHRR
ncbi:MAG: hypothetical protein O7G85_08430 [Planctomycetota bacterium]|nr:hypothetical protein [Planctomycetota bacterium]